MDYLHGTELRTRMPWGLFTGGRAVCPDGKVRALARIAATADTYFSIPAAVKVRGMTVSGYVTTAEDDSGGRWIEFHAVDYGKNADAAFPRRPFIAVDKLAHHARMQRVIYDADSPRRFLVSEDTRF